MLQTLDKLDSFEFVYSFYVAGSRSAALAALGMAPARSQEEHLSSCFAHPVDAPSLSFFLNIKVIVKTSLLYDRNAVETQV